MINVVIVEDNEIVREGFSFLIKGEENLRVTGAYGNAEAALKRVSLDEPDVVLMDLELPGMHGVEAIEKLKRIRPEVNIIVITVHENSDLVFRALCAGASGYMTKSADHARLLEAIRETQNGGAPMSSNIARMVVESFQKNHDSPLTPRETEVLSLLAKGKSYSVVADDLFVHRETVKSHIKNIYYKLNVNCKADAIEIALKNRLI
ncbi:response regulator [Roseivirga sp. BDSF3-8]|uniref:response regulator transcription factor n=1 Tax=Roseivirga sp. BDSF3-8 TaxID=3241598 RepID=UPI0035324E45